MVDAFADAFKRYWAVIVTVASMMLFIGGGIYTVTRDIQVSQEAMKTDIGEIRADIRELRAGVNGNLSSIEEFRRRMEANRYTDKDAQKDFDRVWDEIKRIETERKGKM